MTFSFDVVSLIPDSPLSGHGGCDERSPIEPLLAADGGVQRHRKAGGVAPTRRALQGSLPPVGSMRAGNVTGSANAPLPALTCPLPSKIEPVHSTSACRENVPLIVSCV
jgi:hypothetical protein